jgi:hypothetical protein
MRHCLILFTQLQRLVSRSWNYILVGLVTSLHVHRSHPTLCTQSPQCFTRLSGSGSSPRLISWAPLGHQIGRNTLTAYFLRRIFIKLRPYTYVNIDQRGGNGMSLVRTVHLRLFYGTFGLTCREARYNISIVGKSPTNISWGKVCAPCENFPEK